MSSAQPPANLEGLRALTRLAGLSLTDPELADLAAAAGPNRAVITAWPEADLRAVEPPLRAVPAPGDGGW
jgi:hypothetical protein